MGRDLSEELLKPTPAIVSRRQQKPAFHPLGSSRAVPPFVISRWEQ